jgi:hypothetical protein
MDDINHFFERRKTRRSKDERNGTTFSPGKVLLPNTTQQWFYRSSRVSYSSGIFDLTLTAIYLVEFFENGTTYLVSLLNFMPAM